MCSFISCPVINLYMNIMQHQTALIAEASPKTNQQTSTLNPTHTTPHHEPGHTDAHARAHTHTHTHTHCTFISHFKHKKQTFTMEKVHLPKW